MAVVRHKEAIHSGHFMISNFEAEAQDDEENIAVPVRIIFLFYYYYTASPTPRICGITGSTSTRRWGGYGFNSRSKPRHS